MVRGSDLDAAARLDKLYRAKARGEIAVAEGLLVPAQAVASHGDLLAAVVLLKGEPSEGDRAAGRAASGGDGDAARKALAALELDPDSTFWACTRSGPGERTGVVGRVEALVEAVDPRRVIALDPVAGADLSDAYGVRLAAGSPRVARGRTLIALSGLEASLDDEAAKLRVWHEFLGLKAAKRS